MIFSVVILVFLPRVSSLFADTPLHLCSSFVVEEAFISLLLPSWSAAELCLNLCHALFMSSLLILPSLPPLNPALASSGSACLCLSTLGCLQSPVPACVPAPATPLCLAHGSIDSWAYLMSYKTFQLLFVMAVLGSRVCAYPMGFLPHSPSGAFFLH